jgi:hypothetical protein
VNTTYTNGGNGAATPLPLPTQTIVGAGLAHRHLDARQKACMVADVLDGLTQFIPSQKQLSDLFDVSVPYVNIARKLPVGKRTAILRGLDPVSFVELMNPPKQLSLAGPVIPDMRLITDTDLENMVRCLGTERVLEAACAVERI